MKMNLTWQAAGAEARSTQFRLGAIYGPRQQEYISGHAARRKEAQRRRYHLGAGCGKDTNQLPWDSWQKPYVGREPAIWFHEIFHTDGRPYKQDEVDFIRAMTGRKGAAAAASAGR